MTSSYEIDFFLRPFLHGGFMEKWLSLINVASPDTLRKHPTEVKVLGCCLLNTFTRACSPTEPINFGNMLLLLTGPRRSAKSWLTGLIEDVMRLFNGPHLIPHGTPEYIGEAIGKLRWGILTANEAGEIITNADNKGYMSTWGYIINKIYMLEGIQMGRRKKGKSIMVQGRSYYVSLLMNALPGDITTMFEHWSGLERRFIPLSFTRVPRRAWKATQERHAVLNEMISILKSLSRAVVIVDLPEEPLSEVGSKLVQNLMEDSRTTSRWYIVVAMGRKAGHLALGMGKTAGATLTMIAEEFRQDVLSLNQVCHVLEGAMLKRRVMGHPDGVAVVAEGIGEHLDPADLKDLPGVTVTYDDHGHLQLREIPLARILKGEIERRFAERGDKITVVAAELGYELRCAAPIPYDAEYTRDLGWGAVNYLLSDTYHGSALVCLVNGNIQLVPFEELVDPTTNHAKVRMVDVSSQYYQSARDYMVRVNPTDLADDQMVARLAAEAKMDPAAFRQQFADLV